MMKLRIFTDGACSGNPGPGGWAVMFLFPKNTKTISGGEKETTNNRMELLAVVKCLEIFISSYCIMSVDEIEINSDSAYVVNAINQNWIERWAKENWKTTTKGNDVKNCDLWIKLLEQFSVLEWLGIKLKLTKVKGHSGNELNELVDKMARQEVDKIKGKGE